jgi:rod shape-determining protein MreC
MLKTSHRQLLLGVLAVAILVATAAATAHYRETLYAFEQAVLEMLAPVERAATGVGRSVRAFWSSLAELRGLREENERLRAELESLSALLPRLREAEEENLRLRALLDFTPPSQYRAMAATVIGRSLSNWFSTVEIDKGSEDGVVLDCPVVTQVGLVGRVVRVTRETATVLLLVDPQSGVGAIVVRSREPGAVLGSVRFEDTCKMRLFTRDADVVRGDMVITSGLGGILPAGLHIGHVANVRRVEQGLIVEADITPAVDFGRLEEVFVLCGL